MSYDELKTKGIWKALEPLDYLWLNPMGYTHPLIFLPKAQFKSAIQQLNAAGYELQVKGRGLGSSIRIKLKSGDTLILRFVHHLQHQGLVLITHSTLVEMTSRTTSGVKIPSLLHLFEYHVLKDFLHNHGLKNATFNYFADLHYLTRADLVESFNEKYHTAFNGLAEFTLYETLTHECMINALRSMSWNTYIKKIGNNLRPLYFKLARQAGIF